MPFSTTIYIESRGGVELPLKILRDALGIAKDVGWEKGHHPGIKDIHTLSPEASGAPAAITAFYIPGKRLMSLGETKEPCCDDCDADCVKTHIPPCHFYINIDSYGKPPGDKNFTEVHYEVLSKIGEVFGKEGILWSWESDNTSVHKGGYDVDYLRILSFYRQEEKEKRFEYFIQPMLEEDFEKVRWDYR